MSKLNVERSEYGEITFTYSEILKSLGIQLDEIYDVRKKHDLFTSPKLVFYLNAKGLDRLQQEGKL